jgi:hypothetical protein
VGDLAQFIAAWDRGEPVLSFAMSARGPTEEQQIQVAAIEFSRNAPANIDRDAFNDHCFEVLKQIQRGIGVMSEHQFGAARWLAWHWCNGGPSKMWAKLDGRDSTIKSITIQNRWPHVNKHT